MTSLQEKILQTQFIDNLFKGNHRTNIITRYGWTDGMSLTILDLEIMKNDNVIL